ncbi:kelch-like protein 13 [Mya arenaria]|uniref:kelch-like protein 13 n=1 Tax=Mya arenaria TaxID=6604 RepID=UPI0022E37613|nr:kelch-like protein 13 [Mya arenaria]
MSESRDVRRVKSDNYGDAVLQNLSQLRERSELCDFKVSAGGRVFEVHKCLLAATSDYFRVMLGGINTESQQNMVDLKAVSPDGLQYVLDFIYSGELPLNLDNLTEVINTASHLQVHSGLDLCSNYMISLMTFENAEEFLNIADTYSLKKVLDHWDHMIQTRFIEFSQTHQFLKMSSEMLNKHLKQDTVTIQSEFKLFKCIERWFYYNDSRINTDGVRVLSHIRFPLMSQVELASIQESNVIKRCPQGIQFLAKGFRFHMESKEGHPVIETVSNIRSNTACLVFVHYGSSYMPFQITTYDKKSKMFYRLFSDVNGSRDCRLAVVDNFLYTCRVVDFGGGSLMSSVFRFDPRHLCGQEVRPMRRLRLDFALIAVGKYLYVFGGLTDQFAILDSVERYNVAENIWEDLPPLHSATHSMAGIQYQDNVYLSGGVVLMGPERQAMNTFLCYHTTSRIYESKPGMLYARRLHDMVLVGERVYVMGGIPRTGTPLHGQIPIEYYSHLSNQWTLLSSTLSGRSVGHYLYHENAIMSLGHEHHNATEDEVWAYSPDSDTWARHIKAPQRLSLTQAMCVRLHLNFADEKVSKLFMKEK